MELQVFLYAVITVTVHFISEASALCVREGDCVVLKCPSINCHTDNQHGTVPLDQNGCYVTKTSQELGEIYVIRWTHVEDKNYTTIRKEWKNRRTVVKGKFKGTTDILENGDIRIEKTTGLFSGTYECDVYYRYPEDSRSTRGASPIRLTVVQESDVFSACDPVNYCRDDEPEPSGIFTKNVVRGLTIFGGIFGGILLIFATLCLYSQYRNERVPTTDSPIYNQPCSSDPNSSRNFYSSSDPNSYQKSTSTSPISTIAHPFYTVPSTIDNSSGIYDEINDEKNPDKFHSAYSTEINRQDSKNPSKISSA